MSEAFLAALRTQLKASQLRNDDYARSAYGVDRTTQWTAAPTAVVFPESTEDVQIIVRLANAHKAALVPSGGRTGLSGGAVAMSGEVVLSLERMNRVLKFDAVDQQVEVQAGLVTRRLQEFALEQGLFYPVDFASSGSSQIGGNIATNAGGIRVIRYGMTREHVRGLVVVTGEGERLQLNRGLLKNNTGYDFRHLMIGSEGTLGVICEATMALSPQPADPTVMVLGVAAFADLLTVLAAFKTRLCLNAFECFSQGGLEKVVSHAGHARPFERACPYYALIEFEESDEALQNAMDLFEQLHNDGVILDGVVSQSLGEAQRLWRLREDLSETLSRWKPYKNDISVTVSALPDFLAETEALVRSLYPGFEIIWYGHIGDGNLHLNILKPDSWNVDDFVARCAGATEKISAVVARYGGSISAEHGVGLLKKPYLAYSRSAADIALMRSLKRVFDPNNVLNPGKIF